MSLEKNEKGENVKAVKEEQPKVGNVFYDADALSNVKSLGIKNISIHNNNSNDASKNNSKSFENILPRSYEEMDQEFLAYLKNFNEFSKTQEEVKNKLKKRFFCGVMVLMGAIIFFPYFLIIIFRNQITDFSIIALSITSLAETLSAVIVLPKIIAEYLFNKTEEKNKIDIISNMQIYNRGKREQFKESGDSFK